MKQRWISSAAVALSLLTLAACGGGQSGSAIPAATGPSVQNGLTGMAKFVVSIPHKTTSSAMRNPKYITSAVQGIDFMVTAASGTGPSQRGYVFYALTPQSTYCTNGASALTCTLPVQAYPGADLITVHTYDGTVPATSNIISSGYVTATIVPGIDNPINITTFGVVSYMVTALDTPYPAVGPALTQPLRLVALDASHNVIIGDFDMPLSVASSDTTGGITVSSTTISSSATIPNVVYTGANVSANITVKAASPATLADWGHAITSFVRYQPNHAGPYASPAAVQFTHVSSAAQTVTLNAANGASTTFGANPAASDGDHPACSGIVTTSVSGSTATITPVKVGTCGLVLTSGGAATGTMPIVVSP